MAEQTQRDSKILSKEATAWADTRLTSKNWKMDIVHIPFRFSGAGFYPTAVGKYVGWGLIDKVKAHTHTKWEQQ